MSFLRILRPDPSTARDTKPNRRSKNGREIQISPKTLRMLDQLQIRGSRSLRGEAVGIRSSYRRKPSSDFREHRMYVPGDDIRFVDWRASARHEQIFIRQGELPKNVTVCLLVDCSASMEWGEPSKRNLQLNLAAALGYLALSQSDRLMILPYGGGRNRSLGPITGKSQMAFLVSYLEKLRYGGDGNLDEAVARLGRLTSLGGVVFILSDLLERGNLENTLKNLPAPHWWVNVIHLMHPSEVNPGILGEVELVDVETGGRANFDISAKAVAQYKDRIEEWQKTLDMACVDNHAYYSMMPTDWSLEREVIAHLRKGQVLTAL